MKHISYVLFLFICTTGFAQPDKLYRKQLLELSGLHYESWPSSAKSGDTLRFYRSKSIVVVNFKRNQRILVKGFGRTYSGEPFVECKEKGKWHLLSNNGQMLVLDFAKSRVELQLISNKKVFLEFIVKNQFTK